MPEPAKITDLDAAGPLLCALGHRTVTLAWSDGGGAMPPFYAIDWRDAQGRFFSGTGESPSEAEANALRHAPEPATFTTIRDGFVCDA